MGGGGVTFTRYIAQSEGRGWERNSGQMKPAVNQTCQPILSITRSTISLQPL